VNLKRATNYFRTRDFRFFRSVSPQTTANNRKNFFSIVVSRPLRPPLSALVLPDGHIELLESGPGDEIPKLHSVRSAPRRKEFAYPRKIIDLREGAVLDPPTLGASLDSLLANFASSLTSAGLYPEEAHAMLESWKDSWFEEGSRLIYIVPRLFLLTRFYLSQSNLSRPVLQRVFVGRMELVTPATEKAIETALVSHDGRNSRKIWPFFSSQSLETMIHRGPGPPLEQWSFARLSTRSTVSYVAQNTGAPRRNSVSSACRGATNLTNPASPALKLVIPQ